MNRMISGACALVVMAGLCAAGAQAQSEANPWNGKWKVEPGSMQFIGATYTITTTPTGYTVMLGGEQVGKVDCTGAVVKNPSGTQTTCKKSAGGYTSTNTRDGKPVSVVVWTVSADGKKLTRKAHITPAAGAPYDQTFYYKRTSGTKGMDGAWLESGFDESQDTGILGIDVNGDMVAFKETDSPEPIQCKLDGTPTKYNNGTMSVTLIDPHTLKVRYAGPDKKVVRENTFALSLDGKEISETDFTAAPTPSSMTLLFHKM